MKERCIRWSSEPFLQDVQSLAHGGGATQILLKNPTYNRFYRLYLRFQQRLKITRDAQKAVDELSLKKVSALYELWSVFTLSRMVIDDLLPAGYRIISNSTIFEVEKDYFQFDVRKNTSSIVLAKDDLQVKLKYEPIYPNQSQMRHQSALVATTWGRNPLTPDLAIEVYQGDRPCDLLIFDAKYRREKENRRAYPKRDDLNKMRDYHASIQYQQYTGGGGRDPYTRNLIVNSAYILYPGDELYKEEPDRSIGALPLVPGMPATRLHEVRAALRDMLYQTYLIDLLPRPS
ncbi:MAG TPA: nuclease domain-containing protein [Ktedonobacteraceae bacterium]|nr:nuclease domain-containing protein [Ktedonobacteraceae bacterium]